MTTPIEDHAATILLCPFCGEPPASAFVGDDDGGYWAIECAKCMKTGCGRFIGCHCDDETSAVAAWNTRTEAATIAELRERLEKTENQLFVERGMVIVHQKAEERALARATAAERALVESEAKLCDFVALLASRDMWIVDKGLWHAFVDDVAEYHNRAVNSDLSEYDAPASARLAADVLTALGKTKDPQLPDDEHMLCITFNSEADLDAFDAAVAAWRAGRT